jgi:uncharacterized integral membrane protein
MGILIIVIIILLLVTIFSVQNAAPVAISFFFWKFTGSLAIVVFLSVLIGIIIGSILMLFFQRSGKHGIHKNKQEITGKEGF